MNRVARFIESLHPELQGKARADLYLGVPLFGLVGCGLLIQAGRMAVDAESPMLLAAVFALPGLLFVWAATYIWFDSRHWYARLTRIQRDIPAVLCILRFCRNIAGSPIVTLEGGGAILTYLARDPEWDLDALQGRTVSAHIDFAGRYPIAVLETPAGLVWPLKADPKALPKPYPSR